MISKQSIFHYALIILMTCAGLWPWLSTQMQMSLNTNHAWLFAAAGRLLDGGTMLSDVYEPNPPLSTLLYFPEVLLNRLFSVPAEYTPYIMGLVFIALSTFFLWHFLRLATFLSMAEKVLFLAIYIIGCTVVPSNLFFAERDEIVFLGLVPFMVAQLMITYGHRYDNKCSFAILLASALLILIKPHYILVPILLFFHRMYSRWNVTSLFKDRDVWAGVAAILIYAVIIALFFRDYATVIFPDLLTYYVRLTTDSIYVVWLEKLLMVIGVLGVIALLPTSKEIKAVSLMLVGAGLVSLMLFLLQMKGFTYHLIPARLFVFCGIAVAFYGFCQNHYKAVTTLHVITLIGVFMLAYVMAPLKTHGLTHDDYKQLKLPQLVKSCGSPCPFFVFSENMEMIWQTSLYSGEVHASRFPGLWWLHTMLETGYTEEDKARYAAMVGEDLKRYDPKMLVIATSFDQLDGQKFDLIKFLGTDENFKAQMARYERIDHITDDRGSYFRGTTGAVPFSIEYDVYMRK